MLLYTNKIKKFQNGAGAFGISLPNVPKRSVADAAYVKNAYGITPNTTRIGPSTSFGVPSTVKSITPQTVDGALQDQGIAKDLNAKYTKQVVKPSIAARGVAPKGGIGKVWDGLGTGGQSAVTQAGSAAVGIGTDLINKQDDPAKYTDANVAVDAAGGALSGALSGVSGGVYTMALGAVIGGITGLLKGKGKKKDAQAVDKQQTRTTKLKQDQAQKKAVQERASNSSAIAASMYGGGGGNTGGYGSNIRR